MCNGCIGLSEVYADCGHKKRFVVIYPDPNHPEPKMTLLPTRLPNHYLEKPSLCKECYCKKEEKIFEICDVAIELYEALRNWPRDRNGDIEVDIEGRLKGYLDTFPDFRDMASYVEEGEVIEAPLCPDDCIANRTKELKRLREDQGIWGDG